LEVFTEFELNEVSSEKDHDHVLVATDVPDEADEMETYRCWEAADEPFLLAVEDDAPEAAVEVAESEGWEVTFCSELERERVKRVQAEVTEQTVYYAEEPPEERFIPIGRRRAKRFLESRGVWSRAAKLNDSWLYPELEEFVAVFDEVDESGEAARVAWRARELDASDIDLLLEGQDPQEIEEQPTRSIDELAELIDENSPIGTRESEILACYLHGIDSHAEMADQLDDVSRGAISSSAYHLEDKVDGMAWLFINVIANVPEENRPDTVNEMLDAVQTGNPITHDEVELDGETLLR
jgi:hypothetical protein